MMEAEMVSETLVAEKVVVSNPVIKYFQFTSRVNWLRGEKATFQGRCVLVFRVLMCLENQSVSYLGLTEFHDHEPGESVRVISRPDQVPRS
jgi:hypothetical protein